MFSKQYPFDRQYDSLWEGFPCQVRLESTGNIMWIPPYIFTTTCKLDLTWFPFDQQECTIKLGSWTHSGWQLDIQLKSKDGLDISGYVRNEEWDLRFTSGKRNEVVYECCPEPYLDVTYTLHLTRKASSHIQRYLVPSAFLTSLGILSLLLPAIQASSRLLILLLLMIMISIGSIGVPQPSLMATLLGSCTFTLLLLAVHTVLIASLANSLSFYLAGRWAASKENEEEASRARAQRIAWWIDFAAFCIFLLCFGVYFTSTVAARL